MPRSLGGTAKPRGVDTSTVVNVTSLPSYGDPNVPLVSIFSPLVWHAAVDDGAPYDPQEQQQQDLPRPRPSLQVYYTASDAGSPARLELAARSLEMHVLGERHQGRDPAECDRLDVYGLPGAGAAACVAHQEREIAARGRDETASKDWYIQRYDIGGGAWRRALIIVENAQAEWNGENGSRQNTGLSVVFFDAVDPEDGGGGFWRRTAGNVEEEEVLVRELKAELNWQHSASQFGD